MTRLTMAPTPAPQKPRPRPSRWKGRLVVAVVAAAPVLASGATALAAPPAKAPAAADNVQKATALFVKANELFKAKKYPQALDLFKQSFALVQSPNSHLYIARCLAATGDARAAWIEFDRTAEEATAGGEKYAPTHDSALQERDELSSKVALVTIAVPHSDPAMTVRVGTTDVPPDRWGKPFPVEPGALDVLVQLPGKPPVTQHVTVGRGERRDVNVDAAAAAGPVAAPAEPVAPPQQGPDGLRIGAYVAGGVGVIGFALFAAEGSLSKGTYNKLDTACGGVAGCPNPTGGRANADSLISTGKTQQAVANAGLAVGIVGVAAGATLFVLSLRKKPSDAGQPTADLVVGPSWAGVHGSF